MRIRAALVVLGLLAGILPLGPAHADTKLTDVRVNVGTVDDPVLLAADVYVPSVPDRDDDDLYPCVVELTPYRKEMRASEGAGYLPSQGIALIEVDARGTGGSQGEYDVVFSLNEQSDMARMIDWAATKATKDGAPVNATNKLCESTVGTYGGSYSGIIQYLVASLPLGPGDEGYGRLPAGSPYLAAIAPQRAYGDLYRDIVYHGGQVIGSFGLIWSGGTTGFYTEPPTDTATSSDAREAWADHLTKNDSIIVNYFNHPYADAEFANQRLYEDSSILPRISNLRVPALHLAGFFDAFTRGQLMTFKAAQALEGDGRGPNFLIAGPWTHGSTHFINPEPEPGTGFKEQLRDWYRWWLEDRASGGAEPWWIANGFDGAGARVKWCKMLSGKANVPCQGADGSWQTAASWPPPVGVQKLHLRAGGVLSGTAPTSPEAFDTYAYNPTAGMGETPSRWDNAAFSFPFTQVDQRIDEPKGVGYQTEALASNVTVAGPIGLTLWASTTGPAGDQSLKSSWPGVLQAVPPYHDTDFVVKLSDVAPDGTATLVTDGFLRASHREVDVSKSGTIDGEIVSPYHPHTLAALDPPVPGDIREYKIEIWPTAKTFAVGHRIRIDVYSADFVEHINLLKPAVNSIYHELGHDSYLTIPVLTS